MTADVQSTTMPGPAHSPRFEALDGLRGVAITLVLIVHANAIWNPGGGINAGLHALFGYGWVGVDLFFVLSGFLITGILIDAKGRNGYFRSFYWRRFLRIFPLYYSALAIIYFVLPLTHLRGTTALATLGDNAPWYWLYATNFLVAIRGWEATPLATSHFWSLGLEEQFYLVWPVVVWFSTNRMIREVSLAVVVAALAMRILLATLGMDLLALQMLPLTRADTLLAGAWLAVAYRDPSGSKDLLTRLRPVVWISAGTLAVLIVVSRGTFNPYTASIATFGYSAIAWLSVCGISWAIVRRPIWLARGVFPWLGKYSYCIYIVHLPVVYVMQRWFPALNVSSDASWQLPRFIVGLLTATAISAALAYASWWLWELHWLRLKGRVPLGPATSKS